MTGHIDGLTRPAVAATSRGLTIHTLTMGVVIPTANVDELADLGRQINDAIDRALDATFADELAKLDELAAADELRSLHAEHGPAHTHEENS